MLAQPGMCFFLPNSSMLVTRRRSSMLARPRLTSAPFFPSWFQIPPQDVGRNREDSEDLLQACASAEEQVKVGSTAQRLQELVRRW